VLFPVSTLGVWRVEYWILMRSLDDSTLDLMYRRLRRMDESSTMEIRGDGRGIASEVCDLLSETCLKYDQVCQ